MRLCYLSQNCSWDLFRSSYFTWQWPYWTYSCKLCSLAVISLNRRRCSPSQTKNVNYGFRSESSKALVTWPDWYELSSLFLISMEIWFISFGEARSWLGYLDRKSLTVISFTLMKFHFKSILNWDFKMFLKSWGRGFSFSIENIQWSVNTIRVHLYCNFWRDSFLGVVPI